MWSTLRGKGSIGVDCFGRFTGCLGTPVTEMDRREEEAPGKPWADGSLDGPLTAS